MVPEPSARTHRELARAPGRQIVHQHSPSLVEHSQPPPSRADRDPDDSLEFVDHRQLSTGSCIPDRDLFLLCCRGEDFAVDRAHGQCYVYHRWARELDLALARPGIQKAATTVAGGGDEPSAGNHPARCRSLCDGPKMRVTIDAVQVAGADPLRAIRSTDECGESAAVDIETDPSEPERRTAIQAAVQFSRVQVKPIEDRVGLLQA